jgi:uridine kinase
VRSYIVGIAGGSAAGKSTLTRAIREVLSELSPDLSIETISTDAYFVRGNEGAPTFTSPTTGNLEFDCNRPNSVDANQLLLDIELARNAAPVVIVEGLMILHTQGIRERLDLKIFVDTDADVRALRRMLRDLKGGRMFSDPENIARYYLESAKPGHERYVQPSRVFADLVVSGDADLGEKAALLANLILSKVS